MSGLVGKRVRAAVPGLGEENGAACGGGGRASARPRSARAPGTELGPAPRPYRGTSLLRGVGRRSRAAAARRGVPPRGGA